MMGFVVFRSLALLVVLVFLVRARFLGALREFDSTEKTPAHHARLGNLVSVSSRSRIWKRLLVSICGSHVLHECHHSDDGSSWWLGSGRIFGLHWPTSPGFA